MTEVIKLPVELTPPQVRDRKLVPPPVVKPKKHTPPPDPEVGKELHVRLSNFQAKRYDVNEKLGSTRSLLHDLVAELITVEGKQYDHLVIEYGQTSVFISALEAELVEIDCRIHSTELGLVDYDLAITGVRIRELLIEGRSIRNKMDALMSELRPLMVPSSGSAHRKRIVELKNEKANTRHLAQVNDKELHKAKQDEAELTERRNELTGEGKLEPVPEPGHNKYAHLRPI